MAESQRLQYLEALGVDVWVLRGANETAAAEDSVQAEHRVQQSDRLNAGAEAQKTLSQASYVLGPGTGQTLLLCRRQEEASLQIASDIARCLGEAPIWGWAQHDGGTDSQCLLEKISDRLITRILVFDSGLVASDLDDVIRRKAAIIHAASLDELAQNPAQKQLLWMQIAKQGWCRGSA
jgi:hypothetical protein